MAKRRTPPLPRKAVNLTDPQWRAIAAILHVAAGIIEDPAQKTMAYSLYDEIARQVNVQLTPIDEEEEVDA